MPGRIYGTVTDAGSAIKSATRGSRRGPSRKNLGPRRVPRPSPTGEIMSKTAPLKGSDRGTG